MPSATTNNGTNHGNPSRTPSARPLTETTQADADRLSDLSAVVGRGTAANRDRLEGSSARLDDSHRAVRSGGAQGSHAVQEDQQEEQQQSKSRAPTSTSSGGFEMPAMEELMANSEVAKGLDAEDQVAAYKEAEALDYRNALQTMNFGLEEQNKSSEVTREYLNEMRGVDLEEISRLLNDMNVNMQQLKIGDLEEGLAKKIIGKLFPKKQADLVKMYLEKHKSLSEIIDLGAQAMAEERMKLEEHHGKMSSKILENEENYRQLGMKVAAAEMSYARNKKEVEMMKENYQSQTDPKKAREISLLDEALTRQARRINSLKSFRQETLTALRTMDIQLSGIESQIAMIDEQAAFNRLVFDNTVLMTATDKRMKNSVDAVKYNREQVEQMLKNRSGSIADTLRKIIAEQGSGVVNAAVLEYAAQELLRMNRAIIDGNLEIRKKMKDADKVIERIDNLVKDAAAQAGAMSSEDVAKLDELLAAGGVTAEVKKTTNVPPTPTRGGRPTIGRR
jgi:uncharacterized protein YaaN involved in tellurite resistance